jgi:transcription initiation factor TFIIA small subunit|tara:strand:+ start:412 stop:708 length:297 start_codon:yes stop_codon:yes gene_type:complete
MALTDALDEMVIKGLLTPSIAIRMLSEYDKCMVDILRTLKQKVSFKGNIHTYRYYDNVWTFILEDVVFNFSAVGEKKQEVTVDFVKIVACDGKIINNA